MNTEDLIDAVMCLTPAEVIDLALSSCEVRADLESDDQASYDAWKSVATKLDELRNRVEILQAADAARVKAGRTL